jgi:hypothetical protein
VPFVPDLVLKKGKKPRVSPPTRTNNNVQIENVFDGEEDEHVTNRKCEAKRVLFFNRLTLLDPNSSTMTMTLLAVGVMVSIIITKYNEGAISVKRSQ